jgi:hypothetical protein
MGLTRLHKTVYYKNDAITRGWINRVCIKQQASVVMGLWLTVGHLVGALVVGLCRFAF